MNLSSRVIASARGVGQGVLVCEGIDAVLDCAVACDACAAACLLEPDAAHLGDCVRACLSCADVCYATARLLGRLPKPDSRLTPEQLELCRLACLLCAEVCDHHAAHHEHCRLCAEACRRCDVACACLIGEAR